MLVVKSNESPSSQNFATFSPNPSKIVDLKSADTRCNHHLQIQNALNLPNMKHVCLPTPMCVLNGYLNSKDRTSPSQQRPEIGRYEIPIYLKSGSTTLQFQNLIVQHCRQEILELGFFASDLCCKVFGCKFEFVIFTGF